MLPQFCWNFHCFESQRPRWLPIAAALKGSQGLMEGECLKQHGYQQSPSKEPVQGKNPPAAQGSQYSCRANDLIPHEDFSVNPPSMGKISMDMTLLLCCCDVSTSQQRILPFAPGKKFWGALHRLAAHDVSREPVPGAIEILPARRSRCGRPWVFRHCAIAIPRHRSYVNKHFLHRKTRSKPILYWKCSQFHKGLFEYNDSDLVTIGPKAWLPTRMENKLWKKWPKQTLKKNEIVYVQWNLFGSFAPHRV